ncbi:MAG: TM2 domain-containing protein [Asticcacaulis sp.]
MRGKVLSFDDNTAQGLISGDDGNRYSFTRGDLGGGARSVAAGTTVDFEGDNGVARSVYILQTGSEKNKIVAALLAFFLGMFGVHKFYLGYTTAGIIMLVCGTIGWLLVLPGLAVCVIAFIEFIVYLVKSDQKFYEEYVVGKRTWF